MKKIIFSVAVIAAATFGVIKANQNNVCLSNLQMENVELLAEGESGYWVCCKFIDNEIGCAWTDGLYIYCGGMAGCY